MAIFMLILLTLVVLIALLYWFGPTVSLIAGGIACVALIIFAIWKQRRLASRSSDDPSSYQEVQGFGGRRFSPTFRRRK
jgi:membrane protein implicated in regulation of membrane protease activity